MKNLSRSIIILFLLSILNLSVSLYSFTELNKKEYKVQIDIDSMLSIETKLESLYEECKARDTIIYRTIMDIRKDTTGLETISSDIKLAEL